MILRNFKNYLVGTMQGLGRRVMAVATKEFIEMRRDRATVGMIVGLPLIQLILFGFAINMNPRHLPTAIVTADHSSITRRILAGMENSTYFKLVGPTVSESEASQLLKTGKVQFVVTIPPNFTRDLVKGLKPTLLLQADATDPAATGRATSVFTDLKNHALEETFVGSLENLKAQGAAYQPIVHSAYNPLAITAFNIVPGLLGVVLTMTMVLVTAQAVTREFERGTMENLLAMPLRPIEVILGKLLPYLSVGYIQVSLILIASKWLFHLPMQGSVVLLLLACLPFIMANLAIGLTFSTLATNQLQAVQSAMFFFLPSILLSGFMFPFRGMPMWAQYIGECLPLSHFLVIVRGILLKGNGWMEIWPEILAIVGLMLVAIFISFKRYRQTLD